MVVNLILKYQDKKKIIIIIMDQEENKTVVLGEDPELKRVSLICKRNQLLAESDKYVLVDFPITPENLELIKQYRQALRDFTNNDYIIPDIPNI
jgi:hypothetical protein